MTDDYFRKLDYEDGAFYEKYVQDVNPTLQYAQDMRLWTDTKARKRQDMWKMASIPISVAIEIKQKHGYDLFKDNDGPRLLNIINVHYPHLKTI